MTDDSANDARTWPPTNLAAIAARLGLVTAIGFAYWHVAASSAVRRLGDIYHAPHIVSTALAVPNNKDRSDAVVAIIVAAAVFAAGWVSRSKARRVGRIGSLVVVLGEFGLLVFLLGWSHTLQVFLAGSVLILAVFGALVRSGLAELPRGTSDQPNWDRYHAAVLLVVSTGAGYLVAVGLGLRGPKEHPVVVPELGEVVILRSDSVGHFALDDDGQLMWLSRSKVDMILVVPESDDATLSENPESSGVADSEPPHPQRPE